MLPVYLCEDNINQLKQYEKIIANYILMEDLDMQIVCTASTPEELLRKLTESLKPCLYFLDIDLSSSLDGFDLAEKIRCQDPRGFLVFITTHSELSYLTFERRVEAMDYILKDNPDLLPARIIACIENAFKLYTSPANLFHKTLTIKLGSRLVSVSLEEIYCIKTSGNPHKLQLYTSSSMQEFHGTIQEILPQLDTSFFICHKSCIVHFKYIVAIDKSTLTIFLQNEQTCPISTRSYSKFVKEWRYWQSVQRLNKY